VKLPAHQEDRYQLAFWSAGFFVCVLTIHAAEKKQKEDL